jgi:hypothetical protein
LSSSGGSIPKNVTLTGIKFPLMLAHEKVIAEDKGKKIETYALYVSAPSAFIEPVKKLMDGVIITADIQGITEHQLTTKKKTITSQLQQTMQCDYPGQATWQINSSLSSANSYKPRGTAMLALGDLAGHLEPKGKEETQWDIGRVTCW